MKKCVHPCVLDGRLKLIKEWWHPQVRHTSHFQQCPKVKPLKFANPPQEKIWNENQNK